MAVLERCDRLELDGATARARTPRSAADPATIADISRRLARVSSIVQALDRAQPDEARGQEPASTPEGLRFVGALHELIAIGLHKPTLEALLDAGATGAAGRAGPDPSSSPIDRAYLLKILDEEVARQFSHPLRPIVELVLNAVDASRSPGALVDVCLSPGRVSVSDAGQGMNLHAILSKLLIPFSTDKRAAADIGRFGVGFFSVLGLGLEQPESFLLGVDTGDGLEGWSIRVVAGGPTASTLAAAVRRSAPRRGTRVTVRSSAIEPEAVRAYLRDALHFFPPERALVHVDGVPVNDGSVVEGGRLFEDVAVAGAPPLVARFHLGGRPLASGILAATYHAGVKVESCLVVPELALIDFPAAVELTEGRDALKPGPQFDAVATAFYRRILRLAEEEHAGPEQRVRLAELAAQVSALMLDGAGWAELAPTLARALLGEERYLVGPDRAEALTGFLGPTAAPRLFVPESFWAERQWQGHLPGEAQLLERELAMDAPLPLSLLAARRPDLPGLALLAERAGNASSTAVSLARGLRCGPSPICPLPCLGTRAAVLVREDAEAVRDARGWAELYALRAAFDRALGLRECDVERDLIVNDPARAGGA
jgi:hypothetical protein